MAKEKLVQILVVEDEPAIQELLNFTLSQAGFQPLRALTVAQAEQWLQTHEPDLMILDWMLPNVSGISYCKQLRTQEKTKQLPILMLTARSEETDKLQGLDTGADDYMTKPFSPRELVARIKALLRRTAPLAVGEHIQIGHLKLNSSTHRVTVTSAHGEKLVHLSPIEFKLISFFMQHPERVHSREQLLNQVWGSGVYVDDRTVDVQIKRLRNALTDAGAPAMIETVRGAGYRFTADI